MFKSILPPSQISTGCISLMNVVCVEPFCVVFREATGTNFRIPTPTGKHGKMGKQSGKSGNFIKILEKLGPFFRDLFLDNFYLIVSVFFGSFDNEPMQSCSVRRVSLLALASASASVYSPPSDRFDHRSFISYKYMQLCP